MIEIEAVCVVVFNTDGNVLGVTRKDNHAAWGFPGGKVEDGESLEQAAVRECLEETGILVSEIEPVLTRKSRTRICRAFLAKKFEGDLGSSEKGKPEWICPKKTLDGPFKDYNLELLFVLSGRGYHIF